MQIVEIVNETLTYWQKSAIIIVQSTEIDCLEYSKISKQEVKNANPAVRIDPNLIPSMEKTLLCATFLEAVVQFYQNPDNIRAFEEWSAKKGGNAYGSKNS